MTVPQKIGATRGIITDLFKPLAQTLETPALQTIPVGMEPAPDSEEDLVKMLTNDPSSQVKESFIQLEAAVHDSREPENDLVSR
ncbi:MAG: hypothetical protein JW718_06130 [Desulfovibrionaceae bacterium]|nr:hypothetical protein [Desulfovibrionaceae bacterium]